MTVPAHRRNEAVRYRVYGHVLSCSAPLPELEHAPVPDVSERPHLQIQFATPGEKLPSASTWYLTVSLADGTPWLRCAKISQGYFLCFQNLASFIFSPSDNTIRCIPQRHTPSHTLHHLLLDQVLPLVLNYRGKEVLHGAAIVTPYGSCAFVGPTGSGKSTLAASFLSAGYSVLTDDCVVLDTCGNDIVTVPAYPGLRLWDDAIAALFGTTGTRAPIAHYTPKQRLTAAVSSTCVSSSAIWLAGIYAIGANTTAHSASATACERPLMTKREALMMLLSLAFKLDIEDRRMLRREFDFLQRLVTQVPVRRLIIPDSFQALPALRAGILQDLARSC